MVLFAVIVVLTTLILSLALLGVVAVSSGKMDVKGNHWKKVAGKSTQLLSAEGRVPKFLERLDKER